MDDDHAERASAEDAQYPSPTWRAASRHREGQQISTGRSDEMNDAPRPPQPARGPRPRSGDPPPGQPPTAEAAHRQHRERLQRQRLFDGTGTAPPETARRALPVRCPPPGATRCPIAGRAALPTTCRGSMVIRSAPR
jgi:hypothetical protein